MPAGSGPRVRLARERVRPNGRPSPFNPSQWRKSRRGHATRPSTQATPHTPPPFFFGVAQGTVPDGLRDVSRDGRRGLAASMLHHRARHASTTTARRRLPRWRCGGGGWVNERGESHSNPVVPPKHLLVLCTCSCTCHDSGGHPSSTQHAACTSSCSHVYGGELPSAWRAPLGTNPLAKRDVPDSHSTRIDDPRH